MVSTPAPSDHLHALGESEAFLNLQEQISRAAKTERPVILIGERGTGKELAAARLHLLSPRWQQPYVTMNCSSLAESLIESELFGHEAGAFTGALRLRKGRFETANGGTLFLDEIATLPRTAQEKILRAVEYGQLERVGSSRTLSVDVRLVAATNVDLRALAEAGRFRHDLLDRLSFEVLVVPPLRERREDILLLARHFARRMAAELALGYQPEFSPAAVRALLEHPWPGNIRELKNVVERAVYRAEGPVVEQVEFDPFARVRGLGLATPPEPAVVPVSTPSAPPAPPADDTADLPLPEAVCQLEIRRLRAALEECQFNQRRAAQRLGLTYHQFRGLYRKHRGALGLNR
ncbi:MAG: phage shock protein operon transcriptional activator [Candidatus Sumerlaeaceae bacterium]|nr:phage shock protein operon transcriptional activator [Candidatus Sumerlaeaceae bacterium]